MADARYYSAGARGALSHPRDRRRSCRYPINLPDAVLGWQEGDTFAKVSCCIVDISAGGCMAELRQAAPLEERQAIRVRPPGVGPDDWFDGVVMGLRKPLFRPCEVRISFLVELPYELYRTLAFGGGHQGVVAGARAPDHERDHYWR